MKKNLRMFSSMLASLALVAAVVGVGTNCFMFIHQPEMPKALLNLRK